MSRISPTDLPQPIYPGRSSAASPVPPAAHPGAPRPIPAAIPTPVGAGAKRGVPKAAIWGGAAVVAAIAAVVAVLLLTGAKPGPGHTSADTSNAVNKLVGGVQLTNAEHSCLYNDLDARPDLVNAVNAGSFDTTAAAGVIAGCVSPQTVADLLDVAFQSAGLDAMTADCIRTELADMSESSLASTVKALLEGDSTQLSKVLSSEAAYCFPSG